MKLDKRHRPDASLAGKQDPLFFRRLEPIRIKINRSTMIVFCLIFENRVVTFYVSEDIPMCYATISSRPGYIFR